MELISLSGMNYLIKITIPSIGNWGCAARTTTKSHSDHSFLGSGSICFDFPWIVRGPVGLHVLKSFYLFKPVSLHFCMSLRHIVDKQWHISIHFSKISLKNTKRQTDFEKHQNYSSLHRPSPFKWICSPFPRSKVLVAIYKV